MLKFRYFLWRLKFSFKENALQIVFDFVPLLLIFLRYLGIPLVIIFMSCCLVNNKVLKSSFLNEKKNDHKKTT
jgi:hypothetical protein